MNESVIETEKNWHQHPWVWFVICVPFSAVLFGIVMIVSANYQPDDLVVDNYYKEGMGINLRLALDENAALSGASVKLDGVTPEGAVFRVAHGGDALMLSVFHVSDRDLDLEVPLALMSDGVYVASSAALSGLLQNPGVWYIEVRDGTNGWRLRQRISTPLIELQMVAEQ